MRLPPRAAPWSSRRSPSACERRRRSPPDTVSSPSRGLTSNGSMSPRATWHWRRSTSAGTLGPSPLSRSTPLHLNLPIATASGTRPCSDWHGTGTGSDAETQTPRDRRICGIRRCRRIPSSERRSRTEPVRRRQARRAALPSAHQRERGNQRRSNRIPPKDAHSSGYIPLSAAGVRAFAWCLPDRPRLLHWLHPHGENRQ
jgi:hypothetical protein